MKVKICYIVFYKPPHQKSVTRYEEMEVEDILTVSGMLDALRIKSLDYCKQHNYEFERTKIKDII